MHEEAHSTINWSSVYKRLTLYAFKRLSYFHSANMDLAQDFASEAIKRHFDDRYASWDQERHPTILLHLGSIINGLIMNWLRRRSTQVELLDRGDSNMLHTQTPSPKPSIESELAQREIIEHIINELKARVRGDMLMETMIDLWLQGIDKPRELAKCLDVSIEEIYNANRRFKTHYKALQHHMASEYETLNTPHPTPHFPSR